MLAKKLYLNLFSTVNGVIITESATGPKLSTEEYPEPSQTSNPVNICLGEDVFETCWRCLQRNIFCLPRHLLEDIFKTSCKHVWKTSCEEVLKMSWRHIWKTSRKHALKTSWKMKNHYVEDVLENMENKKCLLGRYSILGKNLMAFNRKPLTIFLKRFISLC